MKVRLGSGSICRLENPGSTKSRAVVGIQSVACLHTDKSTQRQTLKQNGTRRLHVPLTMYMGDPHSVAAIMLLWRYRAKPKSAAERDTKPHSQLVFVLIVT